MSDDRICIIEQFLNNKKSEHDHLFLLASHLCKGISVFEKEAISNPEIRKFIEKLDSFNLLLSIRKIYEDQALIYEERRKKIK